MSRPINVLECIRQGQIGGGESHLLSLMENIDRSKFHPVVLSFTEGPMVERLRAMGIETEVIYTEKPFDISKWGRVKKFIKSHNIDIVHAHGTRANSNVLWASRSLGLPVAYTVHGWSFHQDQSFVVRTLRTLGEKYLTRKSTVNISVSASNQQSGKEVIPSFESIVINNGIDQKKFNRANHFADIRKELGLSAETILVLFIARFTSHKQPLRLIEAFEKAQKELPGMHLLLVGEGDQRPEAVKMISEMKLQDRISLWPFRLDVPDILAAADIFVLPSLWEGLPIGLLEAMSMGKAVLATRVDGTKEVVQNGQNGILVETNDLVNDLSGALVRLAGDASLRKELGQHAMETVNERFNAAVMTKSIEAVYQNMFDNKK